MNTKSITQILIDSGIEENEAKYEVKLLLEHFSNYTENDRARGIAPDEVQLGILKEKVLERVENRMPVQYIIGKSWFMGEYFKVTPDVLIPRDETEFLVRRAIEIIKKESMRDVLDIGTGSGCIACTIAKQTEAVVLGVDISSDALRIALDNVTNLNINNRAVFRKSDLFSRIREDELFDLIVSNPPYIPNSEKLQKEVTHEPAIALFGGEDGLDYYKKIILEAPKHLKTNGYLLFELGAGEAEKVQKMMEKDFTQISVTKDLAGIERVIEGKVK